MTVANADGVDAFTAADQPYYQYDEVIPQGSASQAHRWKLQFDAGVQQEFGRGFPGRCQRLLGVGLYNSKSKISVRMLAPERVNVDETFFETRIRAALAS